MVPPDWVFNVLRLLDGESDIKFKRSEAGSRATRTKKKRIRGNKRVEKQTNKLRWGATAVLAMLRAIVRDVVRQHVHQSMPLHRLYYRKNGKINSNERTWRSEARRSASARLFLSASRRCSNSASSFAALAACVNANIKSNGQRSNSIEI